MKKKMLLTASLGLSFVLGTVTASQAASTLEKIQANLNHGLTFLLNGEAWTPKDANGAKATPISYKGTTYVPLRAVAEATGAEVKFDGAKQQITISTGSNQAEAETPNKQGERVPFSVNNVSHLKWSYFASGITRNKADLLFGETQYETAFIVNEVNSAGQGVAFKVKEGTKRVGVLVGFKSPKSDGTATYSIADKDGQALATGQIGNGKVVNNELVLPAGTTELYVTFKGPAGEKSTGYILWDESWLEN
ncbi:MULTISPECIES: stalk domain-containing protein [Paenibacillus]|uniref:Copper amine oxidase-like N-terminal domain-containing protein n=1 Tax=Paenibacillus albilobatus TaxID=2716884 RepID=A0A920CDR2_9BACL|nr:MULTISPECIES: stalk domain-containing protein [Paenibacillus]GIO34078.1 hypothetical protein J2TS6_52190 [Paenibacillus albilobatus]